jgi:hypothetical protein
MLVQKLRRFLRHREVDAALREVRTRGGIAWEDLVRDLDL